MQNCICLISGAHSPFDVNFTLIAGKIDEYWTFSNSFICSSFYLPIVISHSVTYLPFQSGEESDTAETEGRMSSEHSPLRHRRGGILKGGRLWKSLDTDKEIEQVHLHTFKTSALEFYLL